MAQHTPGPWTVARSNAAYVIGPFLSDGTTATVAVCTAPLRTPPESAANARLIAEAPTLLQLTVAMHRQLSLGDFPSTSPLGGIRERIAEVVKRAGGDL
jgi:hypothetical protein